MIDDSAPYKETKKEESFTGFAFVIGIILGAIISFGIATIFYNSEHKNDIKQLVDGLEKRMVETNKGTFKAGTFIYTDSDTQYIITGKR